MPLGQEDVERYARQIALPEIGVDGQVRLMKSSALVVGVGGLGSPAALCLAAAGVGRLGLMDFDTVSLSNLQRQTLHSTSEVGRLKVDSAKERLQGLNPDVEYVALPLKLESSNAAVIFKDYDFIIDATDDFSSKLLIAETAWGLGKPHSYAGVRGFSGQMMTVAPPHGPCVRCIFKSQPRNPEIPRGPISPLTGVIGALQAAEAIKCLAGLECKLLTGSLLFADILSMDFRRIPLNPDASCPLCRNRASQRARDL